MFENAFLCKWKQNKNNVSLNKLQDKIQITNLQTAWKLLEIMINKIAVTVIFSIL